MRLASVRPKGRGVRGGTSGEVLTTGTITIRDFRSFFVAGYIFEGRAGNPSDENPMPRHRHDPPPPEIIVVTWSMS